MFRRSRMIALLLVLIAAFSASEKSAELVLGALSLNNSNFNTTLSSESLVLVNYYAPWCAHCKTLLTTLEEVALNLKKEGSNILIANMDVTQDSTNYIVKKEEIIGFPTIVLYKKGLRIAEYHGKRDTRSILDYIKRKSFWPAEKISGIKDLTPYLKDLEEGFLQEESILSVVLGIFPPASAQSDKGLYGPGAKAFFALAEKYELSLFLYTDSSEIMNKYKINDDALLVFTSDISDDNYRMAFSFDKDVNADQLELRIMENSVPLFLIYSSKIQPLIQYLPRKEHVLIFHDETPTDYSFIDGVKSIASQYVRRFIFIKIGAHNHQLLSYFDLKASDLPQLMIADMREQGNFKRYSLVDFLWEMKLDGTLIEDFGDPKYSVKKTIGDEENYLLFSSNILEVFFNSYVTEILKPSYLSEPIESLEKLNTHREITHVENIIGLNFAEKVLSDNGSDSIVYFHAPWCAHCKSLEPVISELAQFYLKDEKINIFRMDGTKNDVPHPKAHILGYPTILFFPAYKKHEPMEYDGERKVKSIISFIDSFRSKKPTDFENIQNSNDILVSADGSGNILLTKNPK